MLEGFQLKTCSQCGIKKAHPGPLCHIGNPLEIAGLVWGEAYEGATMINKT